PRCSRSEPLPGPPASSTPQGLRRIVTRVRPEKPLPGMPGPRTPSGLRDSSSGSGPGAGSRRLGEFGCSKRAAWIDETGLLVRVAVGPAVPGGHRLGRAAARGSSRLEAAEAVASTAHGTPGSLDAFAMYERPLGYEIRDLTITLRDDVAFGHSLNPISGT